MKAKISIICIGVRDFEKSRSFYRDGLGFPTHNYMMGDDHAMFAMEGAWLSLYPRDKLAADAGAPSDGAGFSGVTFAHNVSSKERVDLLFTELIGAGAKPIKSPQDAAWGGYHAYFADPDGYLWEIAYNPFTDLT
ncbi:VOC family protein [Methylocapsa acidiphila]|uniref:VOC family protein n=1 Tax=Methylocapsa acidiphila TaxID=133552 RepID=UPI0003F86A16|nr:VOC family protein [Methylocapsa acidiphila]